MAAHKENSHQKTMPASAVKHDHSKGHSSNGMDQHSNGMAHPDHHADHYLYNNVEPTHRVVVQDVFCTEVYTDGHIMASSYEDALVQGVTVAETVAATTTDESIVWKIYTTDDDILIVSGVIQTKAHRMTAERHAA